MDQDDAARMATRKQRAIELVERLASDLGVVLEGSAWDIRSRDDRWSFRVNWKGGSRVIRVPEELLIDDDTGAAFEGQIRRWFDGQVVPAWRKVDGGEVDT